MTISILLADDSDVIRFLFSKALERDPEMHVVATAVDGVQAIEMAKLHQPNIIVLDIEMPKLDGLSALPQLQKASPKSKIIIVSGSSSKDAEVTVRALSMGASECILKPGAVGALHPQKFHELLRGTIKLLMVSSSIHSYLKEPTAKPERAPVPVAAPAPAPKLQQPDDSHVPAHPHAIAIASSTGGPAALLTLFGRLKGRIPNVPIFITQHMPVGFTEVFATHIAQVSGAPAGEGKDSEIVKAGHIYVAPGGYHMTVKAVGAQKIIRLNQDPLVNSCRPSADPMFDSISEAYGENVLAIVLTGIGTDGTEGAKKIARKGGRVVAQDAASCVVYGMPKYVAEAGICEAILPLGDVADYIVKNV